MSHNHPRATSRTIGAFLAVTALSSALAPATAQLVGDLNCDGTVDNFDIDPFVLALTTGPSTYYQQYPECNYMNADANGDAWVDFWDIEPFCWLLIPSQVDPGCASAPPFDPGSYSLRVFFSLTDQSAGTPQELIDQVNPLLGTVSGPARAYLWAQPSGPDGQYWNGLGISIHATATAEITDLELFNPTWQDVDRWNELHAYLPLPGHFGAMNMIAVYTYGVKKPVRPDGYVDPASNSVLLGWVEFVGEGDVFLGVTEMGITRASGTVNVDAIYFGFGDGPVRGWDFGACSAVPDLTCTLGQSSGACCQPDGTCSETLELDCTGSWLGAGPVCDPNPCPQLGACCLTTCVCELRTEQSCLLDSGLYLGDGTTCGECANEPDLDQGATTTLNPGGGSGDPTQDALVTITNTSGPDNATVQVGETTSDPHPGAGGFSVLGRTVVIETSLSDGQFFMTVQIPFAQADLPPNGDPLAVDLSYYNDVSATWALAVDANTQNSPGHSVPRGDRFVEQASTPSPLSADLGDYGVFWNPASGVGFVWANVDHATDFAPGLRSVCSGDSNCDGVINWRDIDFFVAAMNDNVTAWKAMFAPGAPMCPFANNDVNADTTTNWRDIDPLVAVMNTVCP